MISSYNFGNHSSLKGAFFVSSPFISNKLLYNCMIVILDVEDSVVSALKINQNKAKSDEYYAYPICEASPVDEKKTFLLHEYDSSLSCDNKIIENVFVTELNEKMNYYPKKHYISSGYMSWFHDDFMRDIKNSEWIPVVGSSKLVFDTPVVNRWHEAYKTCKIRPEMMQSGRAYC